MNQANQCGIYGIKAIAKDSSFFNQLYIGQTIDFKYRMRKHREKLIKGNHHSIKLQKYFNKYGLENLVFLPNLLIECEPDQLDYHETNLIKEYDSFKNGFNCTSGGDGVRGVFGKKCTLKNINTNEIVTCESISEFARKYNLNKSQVSLVLSEKLNFVNDEWCNLNYNLEEAFSYLQDPQGTIHKIFNVRKFCIENNLPYPYIVRVINKTRISYKDWVNPENFNKIKIYKFVSPEGKLYTTNSLLNFADKYNLNAIGLGMLIGKKQNQHRGWRLYNSDDDLKPFIIKEYHLIDPNGTIHITRNLRKFAIDRGFYPSSFLLLVKGKIKYHNKWTFSKVIEVIPQI